MRLHISESEACVCVRQLSGFLTLFRERRPPRGRTGSSFNDIGAAARRHAISGWE